MCTMRSSALAKAQALVNAVGRQRAGSTRSVVSNALLPHVSPQKQYSNRYLQRTALPLFTIQTCRSTVLWLAPWSSSRITGAKIVSFRFAHAAPESQRGCRVLERLT
jgi:hypothetical protein